MVNVYGNSDAGDVSAGLTRFGPAAAERVGSREARAMMTAWQRAGAGTRRVRAWMALDARVLCGQDTPFGALADHAVFGVSYLTGSEEGRGPLFYATGDVYEGRRLDAAGSAGREGRGPHRRRPRPRADRRAADRRAHRRSAGRDRAGRGDRRAGPPDSLGRAGGDPGRGHRPGRAGRYANEYASYFTTPEEYGAQHDEGGTTVYGPASGPFLTTSLRTWRPPGQRRGAGGLPVRPDARAAADGGAVPARRGSRPSGRAATATARLAHAVFRWRVASPGPTARSTARS